MSGHRSFQELRSSLPADRQARNAEVTQAMLQDMASRELKLAHSKSHQTLAACLEVDHLAVADLEQRADLYVSHLRQMIEARGGTLEITVRFADAAVPITSFGKLGDGV